MQKPHRPGPRQGHLCICVLCPNVPEVSGLWQNVKKSQAQLYYKTTPVGSKTGGHRPGWIYLSIKRIKGWQSSGWAELCCLRPHQHPAPALVQGSCSRTTAEGAGREPRPGQAEGAAARARGTAPAVSGSIPRPSAPPPPGSRCSDRSAVILREKLTGWLPGVTAETTTGRRKRSSAPSGPGARHGDPSRSHRTPGARW